MYDDGKQKYVRLGEYNQIIIFPVTLEHSTFKYLSPVSAGFCYVNDNSVKCFGESFSLNLKSDDDDTFFATRQVFGIDAALELKEEEEE